MDAGHIIEIVLDGIENEELRDPMACYRYIKDIMKDDEKYFPEYLYLLRNKLPYLPFPLGDAWKRNPDCIICNSFISFGIYDEMAADRSVPAYALPPALPDPVRFFPAPPEEDGIYILLNL